jgi:hypothetical protein
MGERLIARLLATPVAAPVVAQAHKIPSLSGKKTDWRAYSHLLRVRMATMFLAYIADDDVGIAWCAHYVLARVLEISYPMFGTRLKESLAQDGVRHVVVPVTRDGAIIVKAPPIYTLDALMGGPVDAIEAIRPHLNAYLAEPYGPRTGVLESDQMWAWLKARKEAALLPR